MIKFVIQTGTLLASLTFIFGCTKTETIVTKIPEVVTVEVPIPGRPETVSVPTFFPVDKSVGIKSLPQSILDGSSKVKKLGRAVAKVFSIDGSSGTGFFISKDGLFLTNEHVLPIRACFAKKCPGFKIVTGFHENGEAKAYSDFEVLAQETGGYDFAIVKVKLGEGESVDFLELDLAPLEFDAGWDGSTHTVIGHPAGASLHFAEAKPYQQEDTSTRFQGTLLPGNSGGPLIDLRSEKVIGLVKQVRTSPVRDGLGSAYLEHLNEATTIREIDKLLIDKVGVGLLSITSTTDTKELARTPAKLSAPDEEDFGYALRRPSTDPRVGMAMGLFIRTIASEHETEALKLMLQKNSKHSGAINVLTLTTMLGYSLAVGRPLRFDPADLQSLEAELDTLTDTTAGLRLKILLSYFNEAKRSELQKGCLTTVPPFPQATVLAPYNCASTKLQSGKSIFPIYADWLNRESGFKTMDELASTLGLLMMSSTLQIEDPADLEAISDINDYVNERGLDLEVVMRNDGSAMGILKQQLGVGSFKATFSK